MVHSKELPVSGIELTLRYRARDSKDFIRVRCAFIARALLSVLPVVLLTMTVI